uniref:Uncharacterized protein n=2 Tax=Odontoceti TaxID=9722 RepID=A0A8C6BCF9_MONMO
MVTSHPRCGSSRMFPIPAALRTGGSEVDLARIPTSYAHFGAFLYCSRRCHLISRGWEQSMCDCSKGIR